MQTNPNYDWRLTLQKAVIRMGVSAGLIAIAWGIAWLNSGTVPPKYIFLVPVAHAALAALNNYLKHVDIGIDEFPDPY